MSLLMDPGLALNAFRLILAFPCVGIDGLAPRLFGGCRPFKLRPHPPQDQGHFPKRPIEKIYRSVVPLSDIAQKTARNGRGEFCIISTTLILSTWSQ
jgi:hypothetical protein